MTTKKSVKKVWKVRLKGAYHKVDPDGFTIDVTQKQYEKDPKKIHTIPDNAFWRNRVNWGEVLIIDKISDENESDEPETTDEEESDEEKT